MVKALITPLLSASIHLRYNKCQHIDYIYILTTPIIATITLVIGYEYGHHLAALHGRTYRGGIGFGFSLWVSYAIFFIAFVFQSIYITKKNCNPLAVTTILFCIFYVYSFHFLGGYFSSRWSHPYRTMYFHLCATTIFFTLVMLIKLTSSMHRCITKN